MTATLTKEEYHKFMRLSNLLSRNHLSQQVRMSPDSECEWVRYYLADSNNPEPLFEISRKAGTDGHHKFRFCARYNDGYIAIMGPIGTDVV